MLRIRAIKGKFKKVGSRKFIFADRNMEVKGMYKKVETALDFVEREKEVIAFWKENGVFEAKAGKNFPFSTDLLRRTESRISGIF